LTEDSQEQIEEQWRSFSERRRGSSSVVGGREELRQDRYGGIRNKDKSETWHSKKHKDESAREIQRGYQITLRAQIRLVIKKSI